MNYILFKLYGLLIYEVVKNQNSILNKAEIENHGMWSEKSAKRHISLDVGRYITGVIRFFIVLGSGEYPQILGVQHFKQTGDDVSEGLFHLMKNTIQRRTTIAERLIVGFIISFLIYLYGTTLYGIYASIEKNEFLQIILFISVIVYIAIATGPVSFDMRYRMPIMPYIILISSYGVMQLKIRFQEKNDKQSIIL